jgi:hypothetical protein
MANIELPPLKKYTKNPSESGGHLQALGGDAAAIHFDLRARVPSVEVPVFVYENKIYCRISCHVYNDWKEYVILGDTVLSMKA